MSRYEDCWLCARKVPDPKNPCSNCGGKRVVPAIPDVGTMVVYRRKLGTVEQELISNGKETEDSLPPHEFPLMVVRADRISHGDGKPPVVRVRGWLYLPGEPLDTKDPTRIAAWLNGVAKHDAHEVQHVPGIGLIVPTREDPKVKWLEHVLGPSNKPGCWRWRKT